MPWDKDYIDFCNMTEQEPRVWFSSRHGYHFVLVNRPWDDMGRKGEYDITDGELDDIVVTVGRSNEIVLKRIGWQEPRYRNGDLRLASIGSF